MKSRPGPKQAPFQSARAFAWLFVPAGSIRINNDEAQVLVRP